MAEVLRDTTRFAVAGTLSALVVLHYAHGGGRHRSRHLPPSRGVAFAAFPQFIQCLRLTLSRCEPTKDPLVYGLTVCPREAVPAHWTSGAYRERG